jgi:hypothetical protein
MAAQLNYDYSTPKGVAGGIFDISFTDVVTRQNQENDGVLKFGMAVAVGTNAGTDVKVPVSGTTAAQIEGVAVCAANTEQDMDGHVHVTKGHAVSIMKRGKIWGRLADETAPTYGATAYVSIDGETAGSFTATAVENKTVDIGATFGNVSDVANGIAVIVLK